MAELSIERFPVGGKSILFIHDLFTTFMINFKSLPETYKEVCCSYLQKMSRRVGSIR